MRIIRHGQFGQERFGLVDAAGGFRDAGASLDGVDPRDLERQLAILAGLDPERLPPIGDGVRLGCPVAQVGKIVCVGLNYSDHAAESAMALPVEPILFMKATTSLSGPNDDIRIPADAQKTDWEVELGVVIGRTARRVGEAEALRHVAGYVLANDVSERAYQLERGGQWLKGKSLDSFCPVGPWLATPDEIEDPQQIALTLDVNGARMQDGSTATMVFGVAHLVHYISHFMTLLAGDLILTGTPAGVGLGQKPPRYLDHGDVVALAGAGLGGQQQRVVRMAAA